MKMKNSRQLLDILPKGADITILASHIHSYMEYDFHGIPVYVTGEAGAPREDVSRPSYGYISVECGADDCHLSHINLGYIPTGDLYIEKFVLIYFYWFWPVLSLLVGMIYLRLWRRCH
jgi:hypothetical protein